jgi:hypothetical protein
MIRHRKSATAALVIAACCLSACGAPKAAPAVALKPVAPVVVDPAAAYRVPANTGAGPRVKEVTVREGRLMAGDWCADLAASDLNSAMARVKSRASEIDAVYIAIFAIGTVCPELQRKADAQTIVGAE